MQEIDSSSLVIMPSMHCYLKAIMCLAASSAWQISWSLLLATRVVLGRSAIFYFKAEYIKLQRRVAQSQGGKHFCHAESSSRAIRLHRGAVGAAICGTCGSSAWHQRKDAYHQSWQICWPSTRSCPNSRAAHPAEGDLPTGKCWANGIARLQFSPGSLSGTNCWGCARVEGDAAKHCSHWQASITQSEQCSSKPIKCFKRVLCERKALTCLCFIGVTAGSKNAIKLKYWGLTEHYRLKKKIL